MTKPKSLVAVVDDDQRMLESLADLCESAGHGVRAFSSVKALLDSNALASIDCLITDISMPDMNGFELEKLMRERHPHVPVILISGRYEVSDLPRAKRSRFFRKPFDGQALLLAIGDAIHG